MSQNESDTQDVSDRALDRAGVFGFDRSGFKHSYDSGRAQVIVQDGDEVIHVEQLARDRVIQWIDFVAEEKGGWISQWWTVQNASEAMRRQQIAEAKAADIRYEQAKTEASAETQEAGA